MYQRGISRVVIPSFCVLAWLTALAAADHGEAAVGHDDTLIEQLSAEENYRRQCAACHGDEGRGDGRVARRYNPRPSDFRDPGGVLLLSDEELSDIITNGQASMPAFDEVLSAEELTAITAYVRALSNAGEEKPESTGTR